MYLGLVELSTDFHVNLLLAAAGDVQAYQIRAAPASTIAPGVVMASSPALPTQGATEEVTRKREVRLMKNRYWECLPPPVQSLNMCRKQYRDY